LGLVLWQQASAQGLDGYFFSCSLYENPGNPHSGGGNGTVWFHEIIIDEINGHSATGVMASGSVHYIYRSPDILNHHYGRHQQVCHLGWANLPAGYNLFFEKARVYITPGSVYTGQSLMFEGRSHYIYASGTPEIGYIVKYKYVNGGTSEWRALNANMGDEVLAVSQNTLGQGIWDFARRSYEMISPEAEIEVYLVSTGAPSTIVPIAQTAQHRYLTNITQGWVEFDARLEAQPTTTPEPSLDYTLNTYVGGPMGGVQQYVFTLDGAPVDQATCTTPIIPPQVMMATARTDQFTGSESWGGVTWGMVFRGAEFSLAFTGCGDGVNSIALEFVDAFPKDDGNCTWGGYSGLRTMLRPQLFSHLYSRYMMVEPLYWSDSAGRFQSIGVCREDGSNQFPNKFTIVPVSGDALFKMAVNYRAIDNGLKVNGPVVAAMKVIVTYN